MRKAALAGLGVFDVDFAEISVALRVLLILRCAHRDTGHRKGQSRNRRLTLFIWLSPPDLAQ